MAVCVKATVICLAGLVRERTALVGWAFCCMYSPVEM